MQRIRIFAFDEQPRWVLWSPVLVGMGIALYFALPDEPPLLSGVVILFFSASAVYVGRPRAAILALAIGVAGIALGFTVAQWRTALVAAPVLEERTGPTRVSGRVADMDVRPTGLRVVLEKPRIGGVADSRTPEKVRIGLRGRQPDIHPGDWVWMRAVLTPPPPPAAPGAFDFQRQSFFRGIGAVGFAYGTAEITARAERAGLDGLLLALADLRGRIGERVRTVVAGEAGAVLSALMTGEKTAVPDRLMERIRDSGLAHLLAISGLHIGLVAGILFFAVRAGLALVPALALRFPIKKWAAATAIAGALAYALLAGATVPTLRAFLMIGLVLLAVIVDRRGLGMRLVAWAALVILLLAPESLLGASFQLSFAAVTALVAVYETLRGRLGNGWDETGKGDWRRRLPLYLAGVALTTVVAGAATTPFAVYHFNRFAAYGLAANLVAVPVTALWIMPWAVSAFALMPFGLENWALAPAGWGVEVVIRVAERVAAWPGAVSVIPAMPDWGLACIALGGLWLTLWRRRWRLWGGAGIAAGLLSLALVQPPDLLIDGRGRLVALNTGDGRLAVSSLRKARFERDVWLRRAGTEDAVAWPGDGELMTAGLGPPGKGTAAIPEHSLRCDGQGCLYRTSGGTVAIARTPGALLEDCFSANAVVSLVPVRRDCPGPSVVIDRFDLWRNGAHALRIGADGALRVESVNGRRGRRPWVLRPVPEPEPGF